MKIRTDFVTNSSSSSYITIVITMKNGQTIRDRIDNDNYGFPGNGGLLGAKDLADVVTKETKTGTELLENLMDLYCDSSMEIMIADTMAGDYNGPYNIQKLDDFSEVKTVKISEETSGDVTYEMLAYADLCDPNEGVNIEMTYDREENKYKTQKITNESGTDVTEVADEFM